ncbi:hypothetical protein QBC38DRAFT_237031 [Podospora fimiseda]|uniref:Uncharacterized protein n=1 Tax=Podospora fimiseda TaxID=252190 RepID=A0AAN7GSX5_9PEZI|nr:hypothetical protein QBC38DRAFT_237031 [Podospora fimiseda]
MELKTLSCLLLAAAFKAVTAHTDEHQKAIIHSTTQTHNEPFAKLTLFPGSRVHPEDLKSLGKEIPPCPDNVESLEAQLPFGVCLSGEYYLQNNFKIEELSSCSDGSKPKISYYRRRGCKGDPTFIRDIPAGDTCLWSNKDEPQPSYYWSLLISCADEEPGKPLVQMDATPAIVHQIFGGVKGDIEYVTGRPCKENDRFWGTGAWSKSFDECSWPVTTWEFYAVRITNPPICRNGTRARLVRFEDTGESDWAYRRNKCNHGKMTFVDGVVDVNDDDLHKCIDVQRMPVLRGGTADAKGIMWHCDGLSADAAAVTAEKPKSHSPNALVSHNACQVNSYQRGSREAVQRPPTWMEVPLDHCMSLTNHQPLRTLRTPVCPDGKEAMLATWSTANCPGMPDRVAGFTAKLGSICRTFHGRDGTASYSFWCDAKDSSQTEQRRLRRPGGDKRAVFSMDTCKPKDGMWTPERHAGLAATIERVGVDKCIESFSRDSEWVIHANAVCKDGKTKAKMAYWKGESRCRGKPDEIGDVNEGDLGKCVQACEGNERWAFRCSRAFWCEGV